MQQRIVEYEKLLLAPIIDLVADDDVGGAIGDIIEIVQNPQGGACKAKMQRSGHLLVEDRNPDCLDIIPRPMEGRNVQERIDVDAVPAEENHRARKLLRPLLQLRDEFLLLRD